MSSSDSKRKRLIFKLLQEDKVHAIPVVFAVHLLLDPKLAFGIRWEAGAEPVMKKLAVMCPRRLRTRNADPATPQFQSVSHEIN